MGPLLATVSAALAHSDRSTPRFNSEHRSSEAAKILREVPSRTDWWGMLVRVDLSQLAQALDATSRLNAEFTLQSGR
jgi:hypothetical protein